MGADRLRRRRFEAREVRMPLVDQHIPFKARSSQRWHE